MANICEQRVDDLGLYIKTQTGAEAFLSPGYCYGLLLSCNNELATYDQAVKAHIVALLGSDQISVDEMELAYGPEGQILNFTTGKYKH